MTAKKISELSAPPVITGSEILPVALAGNNYKVSIDQIKSFVQYETASPTAAGLMSYADKQKLDGLPSNATANQTDSYLLNRANHTGAISASAVSGLAQVATSGNYQDLINKPVIASVGEHQGRGGVDIHPIVTETEAGFMSPYHLGVLQSILNSAKGKIDDLMNVKISVPNEMGTGGPSSGQVLTYSEAQAAWVNSDPTGGGGDMGGGGGGVTNFTLGDGTISDVFISAPENGQTLTYQNGTWQSIAPSLSDLKDCTIEATTTTGHVLTWDGMKWTPQAPTGGGGGSSSIGNVVFGTISPGDVLTHDGTNWTNLPVSVDIWSINGISIPRPSLAANDYLKYDGEYWTNAPLPAASNSASGTMSSAHFTKVQSLKTVATSGDYADLTNKPVLKNKLSDMDDCTIGATTTGYVLTWSGTKWTPQAPTGGGGGGGGSIAVKSQNTQITTAATTINFIGAGVSATAASGVVTVTVPGAGSTNPTTVSSTPPANPSVNDIWLKV